MPDQSDKSTPNKSFIDSIFDIADQALTPLEAALGPGPEDRGTRGEVRPSGYLPEPGDAGRKVVDAQSWEEFWWAYVNVKDKPTLATWHAFPEAGLRAVCGESFKSNEIIGRVKLEHGKRIVACTSCIIGVCVRG